MRNYRKTEVGKVYRTAHIASASAAVAKVVRIYPTTDKTTSGKTIKNVDIEVLDRNGCKKFKKTMRLRSFQRLIVHELAVDPLLEEKLAKLK